MNQISEMNLEAQEAIEFKTKVSEKERDVRKKESVYNLKKADAAAAKKDFEKSDAELRDLIREMNAEYPLFDQPKAASWDATPIADIPFLSSFECDFADCDVKTAGEIESWLDDNDWTDLNGVGEKKAETLGLQWDEWVTAEMKAQRIKEEPWRANSTTCLQEHGIKSNFITILLDAGLTIIDDVEERDFEKEPVPGIGPKTQEAISEALESVKRG